MEQLRQQQQQQQQLVLQTDTEQRIYVALDGGDVSAPANAGIQCIEFDGRYFQIFNVTSAAGDAPLSAMWTDAAIGSGNVFQTLTVSTEDAGTPSTSQAVATVSAATASAASDANNTTYLQIVGFAEQSPTPQQPQLRGQHDQPSPSQQQLSQNSESAAVRSAPPIGYAHCPCCQTVVSCYSLTSHVLDHALRKPFACQEADCDEAYSTGDNLRLHMAINHRPSEDEESASLGFACPVCGKRILRRSAFVAHCSLHWADEVYHCPVCGADFDQRLNLLLHFRAVCGAKLRSVDQASPQSASRSSANFHATTPASSTKRQRKQQLVGEQQQCTTKPRLKKKRKVRRPCKIPASVVVANTSRGVAAALDSADELRGTRAAQLVNPSHPRRCPLCSKEFPKTFLLIRHLLSHTGEKPFRCVACDKSFSQRATLRTHERLHAGSKHRCELCEFSTAQRYNLKLHMARQHGDSAEDPQVSAIVKKIQRRRPPKSKSVGTATDPPELESANDIVNTADDVQVDFDDAPATAAATSDAPERSNTSNTKPKRRAAMASPDKAVAAAAAAAAMQPTEPQQPQQPSSSSATIIGLQPLVKSAVDKATGHTFTYESVANRKRCMICRHAFRRIVDLARHMRRHSKDRPFACFVCHKRFRLRQTLLPHLRAHCSRPVECPQCAKKLSSQASLKVHMRRHEESYPYSCEYCFHRFITKSNLKYHLRTHPARDLRTVSRVLEPQLDPAPALEPLEIVYDSHFQRVLVPSAPARSQGVVADAPDPSRPHRCDQCGKIFKKKGHLQRHAMSHCNLKPHLCQMCQRWYSTANVLQQHIRAVHDGRRTFTCDRCPNMSFKSRSNLNRHIDNWHGDGVSFFCKVCHKGFRTRTKCKRHSIAHTRRGDPVPRTSYALALVPDPPQAPQPVLPTDDLMQDALTSLCPTDASFLSNLQDGSAAVIDQPDFDRLLNNCLTGMDSLDVVVPSHLDPSLDSTAPVSVSMPMSSAALVVSTSVTGRASGNANNAGSTLNRASTSAAAALTDADLNVQLSSVLSTADFPHLTEALYASDGTATVNQYPIPKGDDLVSLDAYYGCAKCQRSFYKAKQLQLHVRTQHHQERPACDQCGKAFLSELALKNHSLVHDPDRPKQCQDCGQTFNTQSALAVHTSMRHNDRRHFRCNHCERDFHSIKYLQLHIGELRSERESLVVDLKQVRHYQLGNRDFVRERRSQIRLPEEETRRLAQSAVTTDMTVSQRMLVRAAKSRHVGVAEAASATTFSMDQPQRRNKSTASAVDNVAEDEGDINVNSGGRLICDACGAKFVRRVELLRHKVVHTGAKPYQCSICQKSFTANSSLKCHMTKLHSQQVKLLVCHLCKNYFASKSSLRVHMNLHAGARPYQCELCSESFHFSSGRKRHYLKAHGLLLKRDPATARMRSVPVGSKDKQQSLVASSVTEAGCSEVALATSGPSTAEPAGSASSASAAAIPRQPKQRQRQPPQRDPQHQQRRQRYRQQQQQRKRQQQQQQLQQQQQQQQQELIQQQQQQPHQHQQQQAQQLVLSVDAGNVFYILSNADMLTAAGDIVTSGGGAGGGIGGTTLLLTESEHGDLSLLLQGYSMTAAASSVPVVASSTAPTAVASTASVATSIVEVASALEIDIDAGAGDDIGGVKMAVPENARPQFDAPDPTGQAASEALLKELSGESVLLRQPSKTPSASSGGPAGATSESVNSPTANRRPGRNYRRLPDIPASGNAAAVDAATPAASTVSFKRSYRCDHCLQFFNNSSAFTSHACAADAASVIAANTAASVTAAAARGVGPSEPESLHKCYPCDRVFACLSHLRRHEESHTRQEGGQSGHVCPTCNTGFTQRSSLVTHMLLHSNKPRPHACKVCGLRFSQRGNLIRHVRMLHKNDAASQ